MHPRVRHIKIHNVIINDIVDETSWIVVTDGIALVIDRNHIGMKGVGILCCPLGPVLWINISLVPMTINLVYSTSDISECIGLTLIDRSVCRNSSIRHTVAARDVCSDKYRILV
jgi:hypothetical protein